MIYLQLFLSFFQIGLFSFGGGYAAMPLIREQVINLHDWLTMEEFTDLITISEMTPGPIAINSATFVGTQVAGFFGAVVATIGCVMPSCIIVLILAKLYYKYKSLTVMQGILSGLRPVVVALIATAGLSIITLAFWSEGSFSLNIKDLNFVAVGLFAVSLFILRKFKPNPVFVMVGSGIIGMLLYSII